jgi:hypothetical protein
MKWKRIRHVRETKYYGSVNMREQYDKEERYTKLLL